jgi:hypothetical protein
MASGHLLTEIELDWQGWLRKFLVLQTPAVGGDKMGQEELSNGRNTA